MKDNKYYKLLKEVTDRILSPGISGLGKTDEEMEKAKEILLSSGHDLDDVENFKSEVHQKISEHFAGYGS